MCFHATEEGMSSDTTDRQTGSKILGIISALDERGEAGVTELAEQLDIAKSTVHYHLDTLRKEGYVVKDTKRYRLTLRFMEMGERVRRRIPLYEIAKDEIDTLAAQTGELVILMVEEQCLGVYLYKAGGKGAIDVDAPIGRFATLHNRALGKAILAHLDQSRVEEILEKRGLPRTTPRTTVDREQLFEELERIRNEDIAFNREEAIEGLHGVAVPILDADGNPLGAISIAGPAKRLEGETFTEQYPTLLSKSRNVIELNVQHADR